MLIEQDQVVWMGGLRFGRTLGSPLAFRIENRDFENWQDRMTPEALPGARAAEGRHACRPGHADLPGAIKYGADDVRDVLERASARSTAVRVAGGLRLSAAAGDGRGVDLELCRAGRADSRLFPTPTTRSIASLKVGRPTTWLTPHPCVARTPTPRQQMIAEIDRAAEEGDSIGGAFVVVADGRADRSRLGRRVGHAAGRRSGRRDHGNPGGQGRRGRGWLRRRGSARQRDARRGSGLWHRLGCAAPTAPAASRAGMSNGMPIVLRAAVKPVPTMRKPLDSIDIVSGEAGRAHIERSDVAIMPRAAIVGEAMAGLVLADALLTSFGGDTVGDLRAAVARRRRREKRPH